MIEITKENGCLYVRTPYDEDYVRDLKVFIPKDARRWDPEQYVWIVGERYEATIRRLLGTFFGYKAEPTDADAYRTLHLLPDAPPELMKAAYRTLSLLNHPDRGGSTERMQDINAAWDRIRRGIAA